jgi:hypothetical protein
MGEKVKELLNCFKTMGNHSITLSGSNLANGVYFLKLSFGENISVKKMILLK